MQEIFLIEDHDEALGVWRKKNVKNLDLVHIDAHMDFGFYPAESPEEVLKNARNVLELKRNLEVSLAFKDYQSDFDNQTNIGNYIYPAMREGIVKDFYWVVPGGLKEFNEARAFLESIFKNLSSGVIGGNFDEGVVSGSIYGRNFTVCILEKLPVLKQKVLLDIDTDFLVIDSLKNSSNKANIGKRKPWIYPRELVRKVKNKIICPEVSTIAYSVNGGYTPIKYKSLGDEVAYYLAPRRFTKHYQKSLRTAHYFNIYLSCGSKEDYWKTLKLDHTYRVVDNNYGPLYAAIGKSFWARREFLKILKVDPKNPACLAALGNFKLRGKDFRGARNCFLVVLKEGNNFFAKAKLEALFGLARAEFALKNFKKSKKLLLEYRAKEPLNSQTYYLLGSIFEKEKNFSLSYRFYQDAFRLGGGHIELIARIVRISKYFVEKNDIIDYIGVKYRGFKKWFLNVEKTGFQGNKRARKMWEEIKKQMVRIERQLVKF